MKKYKIIKKFNKKSDAERERNFYNGINKGKRGLAKFSLKKNKKSYSLVRCLK